MKPEVKNIDCMLAMKEFPDKFWDLAICDPPYGIEINMNMGRRAGKRKMHDDKKWDDVIPDEVYFDELMRVSKNQIIWGGNYFLLTPPKDKKERLKWQNVWMASPGPKRAELRSKTDPNVARAKAEQWG